MASKQQSTWADIALEVKTINSTSDFREFMKRLKGLNFGRREEKLKVKKLANAFFRKNKVRFREQLKQQKLKEGKALQRIQASIVLNPEFVDSMIPAVVRYNLSLPDGRPFILLLIAEYHTRRLSLRDVSVMKYIMDEVASKGFCLDLLVEKPFFEIKKYAHNTSLPQIANGTTRKGDTPIDIVLERSQQISDTERVHLSDIRKYGVGSMDTYPPNYWLKVVAFKSDIPESIKLNDQFGFTATELIALFFGWGLNAKILAKYNADARAAKAVVKHGNGLMTEEELAIIRSRAQKSTLAVLEDNRWLTPNTLYTAMVKTIQYAGRKEGHRSPYQVEATADIYAGLRMLRSFKRRVSQEDHVQLNEVCYKANKLRRMYVAHLGHCVYLMFFLKHLHIKPIQMDCIHDGLLQHVMDSDIAPDFKEEHTSIGKLTTKDIVSKFLDSTPRD